MERIRATHLDKNRRPDLMYEFIKRWNDGTTEVVDCAMVNGIVYSAVLDDREEKVYAVISDGEIEGDYITYSDVREGRSVEYADCPLDILKVLTPSNDDSVNEWRDRARRRYAVKNPKIGDRIIYKDDFYRYKQIMINDDNERVCVWYNFLSGKKYRKEEIEADKAYPYNMKNIEECFIRRIEGMTDEEKDEVLKKGVELPYLYSEAFDTDMCPDYPVTVRLENRKIVVRHNHGMRIRSDSERVNTALKKLEKEMLSRSFDYER